MARGGSVKRKRTIRSYAGFTTGAAKYTIKPMTEQARKYARQRVPKKTYALVRSISSDVRGLTGAVKAQAPHAHLIEYGTKNMPAFSFLRYGARRAIRELRKFWRIGLKDAEREQRR